MRYPILCASIALVLGGRALVLAAETVYDLSDPAEMVLAVEDNGTRFSWQLQYGQARGRVIRFLEEGKRKKALGAAKMQFVLCPTDEISIEAAVMSVSEALEAIDGNRTRAEAFAVFVRLGPAGPDLKLGTDDDLTNPLADVSLQTPARQPGYYEALDRTLDARASVGEDWQVRWYETEKVFARLDGGRIDDALGLAVPLLAVSVKLPAGNVDGDWELQRNQDILDRINAALGAAYRAKHGTVAGLDEFVAACGVYARYGPAGKDGRMGTDDDIAVPL